MQRMTKEERAVRDADFAQRLRPRLLWASTQDGTAIRVDAPRPHYEAKEPIAKVKHKPTEAEDNAAGRVIRRRQNKRLRGWMPHAKR